MSKELFVSLTPHETKVAVNEDDQLAEIYYERENEYTLAGSIYKGRVTRVLPGMQSAFVDIGLERDAFLYVSDFFEMEEDQEEFEPVRVAAARVPVRQSQPPEATDRSENGSTTEESAVSANGEPADSIPSPIVFEGGFDVPQDEAEAEVDDSRQPTTEDEGARPWRGRGGRRRRGRRGRGFPESKFVQSSPQDQQESGDTEPEPSGPPAGYQPMILPGESISKFSQPQASAPPRAEEPPREDSPRGGRRSDRGYDRGRGRDRDRDRDRARDQSFAPPPGYQPIILPGESISKYQRMAQPQPAKTAEVESPAEPSVSSSPAVAAGMSQHAEPHATEPPVIEPPSFQQEYPETPVTPQAEERAESSAAEPEHENERRYERMNVASIFGGPVATRSDLPSETAPALGEVEAEHDDEHSVSAEGQASHDADTQDRSRGEHTLSASGAIEETIDEDEIDEDDSNLPESLTEQFDDADFEELEEETLEPGGYRAESAADVASVGEELTEAVEEAEQEREALAAYEGDENGDESSGNGDREEVESNGRAELRAPAGTAGYQQRAQRVPFDRRGRGRRGGRRMRGPRQMQRPQVMISDVLKEGQEILVQIAKEPIGKKGARITSHIALPGRFLVYMPTVNHIGVSRKISSDEERLRLKRIVMGERDVPGHGGFIVRTAAEGVAEDELQADIRFLKGLWNEIKNRADNSKSPALIYHDLNLVERLLRDQLTEDFTHVWVDNEAEYERILRFVNRFQPNLVRRVRLYTKETPLFEQFGVQEEINKALKSKVWLKSGGYIVINQTEALVAIDVNTGKYVGKTQRLEDTIVKTNVDAIKEIVRQIRLRDLGGIIVIDFIDMDERKNRQKVMQALEEALKSDRAPSKVLQFNDFGLVAITRKRVKHSLERTLGTPCSYCTGTGLVKSVETICNEIYVEMKKMRRHYEGREILLRVNPEVAKALKGNNARWLNDLEELTGKTIIVKSDPTLHQEQFDI